jgi:Cys-tRNA(Pro)/Cys-tRNA(Cys) deacylase
LGAGHGSEAALTPAIKALERQGIAHTVHRYQAGEGDERTYGEAVAAAMGAEPATVFKTLVAQLSGGELVVAVVPVTGTLDLRRLAAVAGAKSAAMAEPSLAEKATGYVTGGISPFGQRKRLRAFVDSSAQRCETVYVSAGRRGLQVQVTPQDLVLVTSATVADLGR